MKILDCFDKLEYLLMTYFESNGRIYSYCFESENDSTCVKDDQNQIIFIVDSSGYVYTNTKFIGSFRTDDDGHWYFESDVGAKFFTKEIYLLDAEPLFFISAINLKMFEPDG